MCFPRLHCLIFNFVVQRFELVIYLWRTPSNFHQRNPYPTQTRAVQMFSKRSFQCKWHFKKTTQNLFQNSICNMWIDKSRDTRVIMDKDFLFQSHIWLSLASRTLSSWKPSCLLLNCNSSRLQDLCSKYNHWFPGGKL